MLLVFRHKHKEHNMKTLRLVMVCLIFLTVTQCRATVYRGVNYPGWTPTIQNPFPPVVFPWQIEPQPQPVAPAPVIVAPRPLTQADRDAARGFTRGTNRAAAPFGGGPQTITNPFCKGTK